MKYFIDGDFIVSVMHLCLMAHEACCRGFVVTTAVSDEVPVVHNDIELKG